ncbi:MAG: VWA domain-containing protein [Actinobacteria bacterium]|nr:VWA domain-containing protein [Actinomycetota bacterium]
MTDVETGLEGAVLRFARSLRDSGIAVSTPEITDALRASTHIPLENREALRAVLAAALLKEPSRRPVFNRLFEVHFPLRRRASVQRPERPADGSADDLADEVTRILREDDEARMRGLARDLVQRRGDVHPEANVGAEGYVYRALRGLNLDAIRHRLLEDPEGGRDGEGMTVLQRRTIEEDLTERMERFREMLRDEVFSELLDGLGSEEMATREVRPDPDEVDFLWALDRDLEAMRTALRPLSRRLALQLSHRRRHARRGRLDVRRTIRRSLSTGGTFVDPAFRRPVAGKPELALLCDISGSMRSFAQFILELTYALSTQFQRVRTFVFVDALDEVTHLLDAAADLREVLERIDEEAQVVEHDGQSWYGNALDQFRRRALDDLTPRTTLVVLGDARTNHRSTGADALHDVRRRVRAVHWLNPEPRSHWDAGDSEMSAFAPACDAVFEVRNLRQLEAWVREAM